MARPRKNYYPLPDGRQITVCLVNRKGIYRVKFTSPDDPRRYKEISTQQTTEQAAWGVAGQIITRAYEDSKSPPSKASSWEHLVEKLPELVRKRPRTIQMYVEAIRNLRRHVQTNGPADVTVEKARTFCTRYETTPYTRTNKEGAKEYVRSARTVANAVHFLSCLWSHFIKLELAAFNPWEKIDKPKLPKTIPTAPTEQDIAHFLEWLDSKFWELMSVFVRVKMVAGCRTSDLCAIKSDQWDSKQQILSITPSQDKTHRERCIPLPDSLAQRLEQLKGETYLWEQYAKDTVLRDGRACEEFTPRRMYFAVRRLFSNYAKAHPDRRPVKPHDLRRRAVTLLVKATGSVDAAADVLGVTAATARKHYNDAEQAFNRLALHKQHTSLLLPDATDDKKKGAGK